jgi:RimJ/RimL family protein N-acetyltransferase
MIREISERDFQRLVAGEAPDGTRLADSSIAPAEVLAMLSGVACSVRAGFEPVGWLILDDGELVGLCSVVKPPENGVVEIGYGIAPSRRRRHHATDAVGEIIAWARTRPEVVAVAAESSTANPASHAVLRTNGFAQIGARTDDEDGPLICWRCDTSRSS